MRQPTIFESLRFKWRFYSELLAATAKDGLDAEQSEYLGYCKAGARRMADTVAGLLLLASLTDGFKERADLQPIDATEVLDLVLQDLRVTIQEAGARVIHGPLPRVRIPAIHLNQLFANLITNAIKFRDPERPPEILVKAVSNCHFSIQDNGIGIASKHYAKIFVPFQRLHGFKYPGTGLGLTLCSRIAEQYGGRMWVESDATSGSTFHFTLPNSGVLS
jgi:signal transduction histidine kinase